MLKTKRVLKVIRKEMNTYSYCSVRLTGNISSETMEARTGKKGSKKVTIKKGILYPTKLFFNNEREMNTLPDKQIKKHYQISVKKLR